MKFNLTIKDVDQYVLKHLPVILDLFDSELGESYPVEDYGESLRGIIEICSDAIMEHPDELPYAEYRKSVSDALSECSQKIRQAMEKLEDGLQDSPTA